MKVYFPIKVLTTNLFLLFALHSFSQNALPPTYGPDSATRVECANNLSNMAEYMKIDLIDHALPAWRWVYQNCPESSKNIYISGAKIFSKKIEETRDPALKMAYFDTLMMLYDDRIKYFGEEGYCLGRKGMDIIRYNNKEYDKAYHAFSRSADMVDMDPDLEPDLNVLTGLIQTGSIMHKQGKIETDSFLLEYLQVLDQLDYLDKKGEDSRKVERVRTIANRYVSQSNVTSCESIERVFSAKLEERGEEASLLKIAEELLASAGCTNSEFYSNISEQLMEISPDPGLAYEVAKFNIRNDNYEKAAEFLKKAIDNETDNERKAGYQYQLALILSGKLNRYSEARDIALKAAENRENYGEPYLLIATNYLAGFKECNPEAFDKGAIYWLATDYCLKAMQVDPGLKEEATDMIRQYRLNYPSVEETFFRSLKIGDPYRFNCWINETTTVKEK